MIKKSEMHAIYFLAEVLTYPQVFKYTIQEVIQEKEDRSDAKISKKISKKHSTNGDFLMGHLNAYLEASSILTSIELWHDLVIIIAIHYCYTLI